MIQFCYPHNRLMAWLIFKKSPTQIKETKQGPSMSPFCYPHDKVKNGMAAFPKKHMLKIYTQVETVQHLGTVCIQF